MHYGAKGIKTPAGLEKVLGLADSLDDAGAET
jgi:hypothetical protein